MTYIYIYIFFFTFGLLGLSSRLELVEFQKIRSSSEIPSKVIRKLRYGQIFTHLEEVVIHRNPFIARRCGDGLKKLFRQRSVECWRILL